VFHALMVVGDRDAIFRRNGTPFGNDEFKVVRETGRLDASRGYIDGLNLSYLGGNVVIARAPSQAANFTNPLYGSVLFR